MTTRNGDTCKCPPRFCYFQPNCRKKRSPPATSYLPDMRLELHRQRLAELDREIAALPANDRRRSSLLAARQLVRGIVDKLGR